MGLGRTATIGFQGPDGNWTPVTPSNPFPVQGGGPSGAYATEAYVDERIPWVGTQAEYDALGTYSPTRLYVIQVA